jgi:hypothetical protein
MQIPELVTVFNHQVGNTGWTGMRAYHDQALIDEFQRRGIDVTAVYDGKSISFAHPVRYDIADNWLVIIGGSHSQYQTSPLSSAPDKGGVCFLGY